MREKWTRFGLSVCRRSVLEAQDFRKGGPEGDCMKRVASAPKPESCFTSRQIDRRYESQERTSLNHSRHFVIANASNRSSF